MSLRNTRDGSRHFVIQRVYRPLFDISISAILFFCMITVRIGLASPGIEQFGKLPSIQSMSISPDGKHIAFIRENDDGRLLLVYTLKSQGAAPIAARLPDEIKSRGVYFATNTQVILRASDTVRFKDIRSKREMTGSFVFSIVENKVMVLLNKTRGLFPKQTGLGRIVGLNPETGYAYMPAFSGRGAPTNNLYRVSLETGLGEQQSRGSTATLDWFVGRNGTVLARVDFDQETKEHRVFSFLDGNAHLIYENQTELPSTSIQAVSFDETKLLFVDNEKKNVGFFTMDLKNGESGGKKCRTM